MKTLIDCDIIEYCLSPTEERQKVLDQAANSLYKPVYALPTFELCRSLHLLAKIYSVAPNDFRSCWADLSQVHRQSELFIHVSEHPMDNPPRNILNLSRELEDDVPCEAPERYWDGHHHLVQRLRWLHPNEEPEGWWRAHPPEGNMNSPILRNAPESGDLVVDSNNLLELLNALPTEGMGVDARVLRLPNRLSPQAVRRFKNIIQSYGAAGHFIVPICVLEEVDWVANKPENQTRYNQARKVLHSMGVDLDRPLWNIFDFEPITQDILDHFICLYESLTVQATGPLSWGDFGDMLVLAFGLYHGCKIASNEWFEGNPDVWDVVRVIFPYMVLE